MYLLPKLAEKGNKPQIVDEILTAKDEKNMKQRVVDALDLSKVLDRELGKLSGGELQVLQLDSFFSSDLYLACSHCNCMSEGCQCPYV